MRLAAIAAALSLTSCATTSFTLPYSLVSGSEASLTRFENAARACGADVRSIPLTHSRWVSVGIDPDAPNDPRVACAMQWILDHPEEELGFVGNDMQG